MATRSYPDRLIANAAATRPARPFDFDRSYREAVWLAAPRLPARLVDRLLPVQLGTIGRMGTITDWDAEWGKA